MIDHKTPDGKWFAPRRLGYGAGWPVRWQGWAFLALLIGGLALAAGFDGSMRWMTIAVILACALPIAAARTEGGWRWRRD